MTDSIPRGRSQELKKRTGKYRFQQLCVRAAEAHSRLVVAIFNLGIRSALTLYYHRIFKPNGVFAIAVRKLDQNFYFRGNIDWGVMTHFYKSGYRILDKASHEKVALIIDAGANIGTETLRFRFFHPAATIISIEAEKGNFALLSKNAANSGNQISINAGLYNKKCKLKTVNNGVNNESFSVIEVPPDDLDFDILSVSIPSLMDTYGFTQIDILKLDIEGAEKLVFDQSADAWVDKVKVLIFECPDNDAEGTTAQIYGVLHRKRIMFKSFIHGENLVLIRGDVDWKLGSDLLFIS